MAGLDFDFAAAGADFFAGLLLATVPRDAAVAFAALLRAGAFAFDATAFAFDATPFAFDAAPFAFDAAAFTFEAPLPPRLGLVFAFRVLLLPRAEVLALLTPAFPFALALLPPPAFDFAPLPLDFDVDPRLAAAGAFALLPPDFDFEAPGVTNALIVFSDGVFALTVLTNLLAAFAAVDGTADLPCAVRLPIAAPTAPPTTPPTGPPTTVPTTAPATAAAVVWEIGTSD